MIRRVLKTHFGNLQMVKALAIALVAVVMLIALGKQLAVAIHLNMGYLTLARVLTERSLPGLYDLDGPCLLYTSRCV